MSYSRLTPIFAAIAFTVPTLALAQEYGFPAPAGLGPVNPNSVNNGARPGISNSLETRRRPPVPTGPAPKAPDGKPDLSGAWEPNAFRANVDLMSTGVQVPFQPWAEKLYKQRKEDLGKDDPEALCLPPGVPRLSTTPYPFRIVQTPNLVLILHEGGSHFWRQIFTDGRPHSKDPDPTWVGESIGHWDGDVFVVDTVGFNGKTWIDAAGLPTTDALHVTERYKRVDLGHLEIEHIVDDPKAYTKPWSFTTHPQTLFGDLLEYVCNENNKDVEHLVGKTPAKQ